MLAKHIKPEKIEDEDLVELYLKADCPHITTGKEGFQFYLKMTLAHVVYLQLELAKAHVTISQIETALELSDTFVREKSWVIKLRRIRQLVENYRKES
jgi:hypothetical protein